jgi:hypothetical protein
MIPYKVIIFGGFTQKQIMRRINSIVVKKNLFYDCELGQREGRRFLVS